MKAGIIGYDVYIPRFRIKRDEYLKVWGGFSPRGIEEKAVMGLDEDVITMAVQSSSNALKRAHIEANQLAGVFFASTSGPYAEKLSSSTILASLDGPTEVFVADIGSSTKAGTTALLSCMDFVSSGRGDIALVTVSDAPQAMPGDPLEHGLGAGSASMVVSRNDVVLDLEGVHSSTMEIIGERYRKQGERYLKNSGIAAYTEHAFNQALTTSVTGLLRNLGLKAEDFVYAVFQNFDGRSAYDIGRKLGFKDSQISPTMAICKIGDTGSSSPLIGLCAVLDEAKERDRILVASYGSGCSSDAMSLVATDRLLEQQERTRMFHSCLAEKEYIDYTTYLKFRRMLGAR